MNNIAAETFNIPTFNMVELDARLAKINKRADKIGAPHISYKIVKQFSQTFRARDRSEIRYDHLNENNLPVVDYNVIELIGQGPKIENFTFVGTLDHNTIPNSVIVKTVPSESIPEEYFHSDGNCDHCNRIRRRNETFVLRHDDGHHVQIGRSCIKDFIGHDPKLVAQMMESIAKLTDDLGSEESFGFERYVPAFDHITVLRVTIGSIRKFGWVARSACNDNNDKMPTSGDVLNILMPSNTSQAKQYSKDMLAEMETTREADEIEAKAAIEWLDQQPANNEYIHNLKALRQASSISIKMFGFWCSLMASYQKVMDKLRMEKAEASKTLNEWVATAGSKIESNATVTKVIASNGYYGMVYIHYFSDDAGRTLVWFANSDTQLKVDKEYKIKGTVKKCDEYKGRKQTVLTRVKVI